jgi:hypothetical protein
MKNNKIDYAIETARSGHSIVVVNDSGSSVPLNSRFNPVKEGGKLSYDLEPERFSLLIVVGCALGYNLVQSKDTLERFRTVVIIDVLEGIESEIEANPVTSFLAGTDNVRFYSGKDIYSLENILKNEIDFSGITGVQVIEHSASVRVFNEYYSAVKELIRRLIDTEARNSSTVKAFGKLFLRNAINNFKYFDRVGPVAGLKNRFKGSAAFIVSSAPSVEDYIEKIGLFSHLYYIVAVDSALPLLRERGIKPDFVISIDPQPRIFEHFLEHDAGETVYIFSIVSSPELLKKFGGYITLNSHPVSQVIDDLFPGAVGSIDSGTGSVAGDALNLCFYAGFSNIAMTGFDFSFSGNNIYARGTAYQKRYSSFFNNRFHPAETFNADYIYKSSGAFVHKGKYTRKSFIGYKDSMEQFIGKNNISHVYSINERGIPLNNIDKISLEKFVSFINPAMERESAVLEGTDHTALASVIDIQRISEIFRGESAGEILRASYGKAPDTQELQRFYALLENL